LPRSFRRAAIAAIATLCIATGSGPAAADIYHFVTADGTDGYSDQPSAPGARLYLSTPTPEPGVPTMPTPGRRQPVSRALDTAIAKAASTHGLRPALLHAVIGVESGYRSDAVSTRGALGLMQLMPDTAKRFGVGDPFDPTQNLQGGARYLRALLDLFGQDIELALAAYNSGEGSVIRHGRRMPPYAETRAYVPKVMHRYRRLLETL
jgi:soluble lytic murein transglycosylase-like protein